MAKNVNQQAVQKAHHGLHANARVIDVGQGDMAHNFGEGLKWLPGTIYQQHGPVTFEVKLEDGRLWKHHTDQLKLQEQNHSSEPEGHLSSDCEMDYDPDILPSLEEHSLTPIMASQSTLNPITPKDDTQTVSASGDFLSNGSVTSSIPVQTYPLCEQHLPDRYH